MFSIFKNFIYSVYSRKKSSFFISIILTTLTGALQGLNIILLSPLLEILGIRGESLIISKLNSIIFNTFSYFNLPINLVTLLFLYFIINVLHFLMQRTQLIIVNSIQFSFVKEKRTTFFAHLGKSKWNYIKSINSATIQSNLSFEIFRIGLSIADIFNIFGILLLILIQLALLFTISPSITLIGTMFIIAFVFFTKSKLSKSYTSGTRLNTFREELLSEVNDFLGGLKIAKAYNNEDQHLKAFNKINNKIENEFNSLYLNKANTQFQLSVFSLIIVGTFLAYTHHIKMPLNELLLFLVIFSRIIPKAQSLQQLLINTSHVLHSFKKFEELSKEFKNNQEHSIGTVEPINLNQAIYIKNLNYSYPDKRFSLTNINLIIPKNQIISITGSSGSGKTTLVDIIIGLLPCDSGKIRCDEILLNEKNRRSWRLMFGYVNQEHIILKGTIKENLLWSNPNASDLEIQDALSQASLNQFVSKLPQGLNTEINEKTLSGGEKQRLNIARALIKKPQILVFDEPSSALDPDTKMKIDKVIDNLRDTITIIIISHQKKHYFVPDITVHLANGEVIN